MIKSHIKNDGGFSLLELLAVIALMGIISVVAISNIKTLESPLSNSSANLSHYFRLVRARAISQTRSIQVTAVNASTISAASATNCDSAAFTPEQDLSLQLDDDVILGTTNWIVCFNQRGLANDYVSFTIVGDHGTKTVQVALGGGVRIQ